MPDRPVAIIASEALARPPVSGFPADLAGKPAGREKRPLGDLFGLANFGVTLTRLAPGAAASLRHAHSRQDGFVYTLEGRPVLLTDAGETPPAPGLCAGFAAGSGDAHRPVNGGTTDVLIPKVGCRTPLDRVTYPEDDLAGEADAARRFHDRRPVPSYGRDAAIGEDCHAIARLHRR